MQHWKPRSATVRGFRSGLEGKVSDQLKGLGLTVEYETVKVSYIHPERPSKYTPDFRLNNDILIETKGRFLSADRQKHKWIKTQHPTLDIRFVFSNAKARLNKKSETTYAHWCEQYGFQWADKLIPLPWINEAPNAQRTEALVRAIGAEKERIK